MTPRALVYLPSPIHPEAVELLEQHAEVVRGWETGSPGLRDVSDDVAGILVRTSLISAADIAAAPNLRVVARHGVGTDNIAVDEATARGVVVTITPDANTRSVAEHTFALLLAVGRKVVLADQAVRAGRYAQRDTLEGIELAGRRLGIVGMGRIGSEVTQIAADGFRMTVLAYDPQLRPDVIRARGAEPVSDLDTLLKSADILTIHAPLTPQTRGMIGEAQLALLPAGAVVLLAARGGIVDEPALIEELRRGTIAGAGVDVFDGEPPAADSGYFALPNVVLTPHTAANTDAAMRRMAVDAAASIVTVLGGGMPPHVVNPGAARPHA